MLPVAAAMPHMVRLPAIFGNAVIPWRIGVRILVVATVIVDAVAPLLQERAAKVAGFESSSMVVCETMSYYVGGLSVALLLDGFTGLRQCMRPLRYFAFLPASFAFSASNFLTYIAVRGLGASQFYLLAQLRIAILALVQRYRSGVHQPVAAWIAMLQLATGMVTLVWYKSTNAELEDKLEAAVAASTCGLPGMPSGVSAAAEHLASVSAREEAQFVAGIFALFGVVVTSAFGFLYLEWQLKLHAQDPIFVQLHQMNSFGAAASLLIHLGRQNELTTPSPQQLAALSALGDASSRARENATLAVLVDGAAGQAVSEGPGYMQIGILLSCIIARGVLSGTVLKQLDSIAKGLIDVTAIVVCTGLQILIDPSTANGTVLGTQLLMLMSIISYQNVRAQPERKVQPSELSEVQPSELPLFYPRVQGALSVGGRLVNPKNCD